MKILIVEDDEKTAALLSNGLKQSGYAVSRAQDGLDGLAMLCSEKFNAVVVDIMMPGVDGLTMVEKIRQKGVETPVIFLSAKNTVSDRIKGLKSGGDDYLVKPFDYLELEARLEAILRRDHSEDAVGTKLKLADLELDCLRRKVERNGQQLEFAAKVFAIFVYLMQRPGRVVSKSMIMSQVWDYDFDPQTNVVEAAIYRLREKVDKDFAKKLIKTVRGVGYVIED
ncbi:MAG: response regulator transcription factor [Lentisphaerales bacterium]|nr:response regulator transcription factor [Lentisphaerales bacterium]